MKKQIALLLIIVLVICKIGTAQETKPVQFNFAAKAINDTTVQLTVAAKISKGSQLFSTKKSNVDDAFVSALMLDTTAKPLATLKDTVTENGTLQLVKSTDSSVYKLFSDTVSFTYLVHVKVDSTLILKGLFTALLKKGEEFPSEEEKFSIKVEAVSLKADIPKKDDTLLSVFLLCFATGLFAIITPCVFPLIPVTVSFFLKRSGSRQAGIRNAVIYSLSIIAIYTIPTILITLIFGDKALYVISTSAISNLLFFAIFIVFAASFFGAFELTLPNSWANKADQQAGKGGIIGIFFMALTLVIVSFSCTGPLVGTLLGQTSTKGVSIAPILGMFGFGLGLALPFSLFAFFPSMLQSLPKSGGWLNSVKVTFGFIELALAMKFLSNVDLIYHWHLLNRDVFLVLWIVVFALMGFYLLGKLKFSHDSDLKFISVPRLFFSIGAFSFALYLVPGLWGAPLKPLSGFVPPATTQDFNLDNLKYTIGNSNNATTSSIVSNAHPPKKYIDKLHVPFGLTAYFDLEEGMAAAKILHKPLMLDFTGHSCANCRKMEEEVWHNPDVLKRIKENFVLVSLYVDESTELPASEQYTNKKGDKIVTVGDKNLDYEVTKFDLNAQPLYMFLDINGNALSDKKYGYDSDIQKFINHLDAVKAAFDKQP
ncbi:protein-disulfide reductase DsbD family protein [Parasediminibacterium paludis]|uniref:Protein-disulfide reductase DsbD family protein n=1 Tax=Parasediminibacterium paludis TaxID=908966 RepID=A0ABV8PXZ1_9BACT